MLHVMLSMCGCDLYSDLDAIIDFKSEWLGLIWTVLIVSSSWSLLCYDLSRLKSDSPSLYWQLTPSLKLGLSLVKSLNTVSWLEEKCSLSFVWHRTQKPVSMKSHNFPKIVMNCHEIKYFFPVGFYQRV